LEEFDFQIVHRPGVKHGNTDALSRRPCRQCGKDQDEAIRSEVWTVEFQEIISGTRWTRQELTGAITRDPEILVFYREVLKGTLPMEEGRLAGASAITKSFHAQWERYEVVDGVMYRRWWDEEYCLRWDACARYHKKGVKKKGELQAMCVGSPWEGLAIDITGPHPLSGKENKFIITVIDHFTKYAFAFPVRNHEAKTVAKYSVERVFLIHGVPLQLLSDRGAEFEGHIFKEICELLGVDKLRTTAYKPSTNGTL